MKGGSPQLEIANVKNTFPNYFLSRCILPLPSLITTDGEQFACRPGRWAPLFPSDLAGYSKWQFDLEEYIRSHNTTVLADKGQELAFARINTPRVPCTLRLI